MDAVYQPNARPTALIAPLSGAEFAPGQLVENKIVSLAGPEAAVLGYKRLLAKVTAFGAGASYRVHTDKYDLLVVPIAREIGLLLHDGKKYLVPGTFAIVPAGASHGFRDRAGNTTAPGGGEQRRGGTDVLMVEIASQQPWRLMYALA
mmetsp:Transcript_49175/g.115064  ORF Transcript_49175/g.115064 Transcript_49175/m.115064 type:complete len:148 (+) Transcript_49175:233-676(+)